MTSAVAVVGWGAFIPGHASVADWLAGRSSSDHASPIGAIVPPRDRRRASPLSRAVADAYCAALGQAGLDSSRVASVFGSALGEVSTMIGLLDQMWSGSTPLSPMKFATSVHNAAAGMVSIATGNRGFTTSLGADFDTPAMALLEGIAFVRSQGQPVVVCCGDEAPPENLVPGATGWSLLAAAVALCPVDAALAGAPQIHDLALAEGTLAPPAMAPGLALHPDVGLLDLVVALERGAGGVVRLDRGAGRGYSVRVDPVRST